MRNRVNILGCEVDLLDAREAIGRVKDLVAQGLPAQVITLNAEIVYQAQSNAELRKIINAADLVTPDGIGIVWAGRTLGYPVRERVTGIELLHHLCQVAAGESWKIFLLGSAPGVAESAGEKLAAQYPGLRICGTHHGYFQRTELPILLNMIKGLSPHIIFVAMGAPKQEFWIKEHLLQLGNPVCVGVGGSLDVIAGQKKRAPAWMIKLNMEWLYRLYSEPSRWQRQLALPKFVVLILKERRRRRCW